MSEEKILEVKNYKTVFTPELVTDLFFKGKRSLIIS